MAYTSISDIVGTNPRLVGQLVANRIGVTNALLNSGVAIGGPEVDAVAGGGSVNATLPYMKPLNAGDYNVSNDDFTVKGTSYKAEAAAFMVARHAINKPFTYTDLVRQITGYDARGGIVGLLSDGWNATFQSVIVNSLIGALDGETALEIGDGSDAFSINLVSEAKAAAGDLGSVMRTLLVSHATRSKMEIEVASGQFAAANNTSIFFDTWRGYKVVAMSGLAADESILCADGSIAFAQVSPTGEQTLELARDPLAGNGAGGEILVSRRSFVAHPQGFNYVPQAGEATAVNTKLMNAAGRWNKALPDADIPFRVIKHLA